MYRELIKKDLKPGEYVDITESIKLILKKSKIQEGICNVFLPGTTAGFVLNENDKMLIYDIRRFFEKTISKNTLYQHEANAHSHLRAMLAKPEITIPVSRGKLVLGDWQNIMLWEFDTKPRRRNVIVTLVGK